ncbi:hypothetical protein HCN44_007047 [Aphidius gifuensis]|uniref:non-specific protein-tyrosine kinase n=1 Tax=Aphidius gifuensis TaxID=684658 RepID=A0A834XYK6_APHGI|nr:tyrosine-protein kinase hopscotch [Aphidius gifuensis]KAF7995940.1 hypothetical protein HCN44_007047 [Aphidius gifuensis]
MGENNVLAVNLLNDTKILNLTYSPGNTAEDLCIKICKYLEIGPVARHLFALCNKSTKNWLPSNEEIKKNDKIKYEFRLRFKPSTIERLKKIDIKAYDYYFHQAKHDVLENRVPDIIYENYRHELIGLGVCDMYRAMLEKKLTRDVVESNYKKYIPRECIKKHSFFIKKPIRNALENLACDPLGHSVSFVTEEYLNQFKSMAPNYPYEEYNAILDKGLPKPQNIKLRINSEELCYIEIGKQKNDKTNDNINKKDDDKWYKLCTIEELCFISIRKDCTVEISKKNGIPSYLKFPSNSSLLSFVSALDGYYRLSIKWTFNLCRDVVTPSLERLHKLKCHGPVNGEFSYLKIKEKRSNKPGTYILRECDKKYNVYYIDVCGNDSKPKTYKIEQICDDEFILADCVKTFKSLTQLVLSHNDPNGNLYLSECIPPSEYDKSSLLICANIKCNSDVAADEEIISELLDNGPSCISPLQLQIYKAQPFIKIDNFGNPCESMTSLYRTMWRIKKGKKLEAAIKVLKDEYNQYTREFLELAGKWAHLRSGALVRLFGLTVSPAVGMVMELVKLGPLDVYLRNNSPQTIKTVDMVEASACLATALWHLEESGIVHGNIRCRKLLVHAHTDNRLTVKLADPGLFRYTNSDIHWIPPECYANNELARRSTRADVWALGTTMWQIFSRGALLPPCKDIDAVKKFYSNGKRLSIPINCPIEIYQLMLECWGEYSGPKKQPQAIMRDINQILYQVYNSRRKHAYATACPKLFNEIHIDSDTSDNISLSDNESKASSLYTDRTSLPWDDNDDSIDHFSRFSETDHDAEAELNAYLRSLDNGRAGDGLSALRPLLDSDNDTCNNTSGPLGQMQGIFELDADCNVILQGRIGQGFYGEVYRGTLERDKDCEPQQVAVKKLKTRALESDLRDFEREIEIMKTLKHPNVVEIMGVISEPEVCLVMEFVKHGSLQSYLAIHRETLTHKCLLGFALDIATGMEYLGRKNIVHRDLAARNILVADENHVKLSDFGLAQVTGNNDYYILQTNRDLPIKWYAPESLRDGRFSSRTDVWSFGVTMYETFGLGEDPKLPYNDGDNRNDEEGSKYLLDELESGRRLPCPINCPQTIYIKLMYSCWHWDSRLRPNFTSLCKDINDLLEQY